MRKKEETSPWATVTARALRGKREKSLVPWGPRKHTIKGRKNPC